MGNRTQRAIEGRILPTEDWKCQRKLHRRTDSPHCEVACNALFDGPTFERLVCQAFVSWLVVRNANGMRSLRLPASGRSVESVIVG